MGRLAPLAPICRNGSFPLAQVPARSRCVSRGDKATGLPWSRDGNRSRKSSSLARDQRPAVARWVSFIPSFLAAASGNRNLDRQNRNHESSHARYVATREQTRVDWTILAIKLDPVPNRTAVVPVDPSPKLIPGMMQVTCKACLADTRVPPLPRQTVKKNNCLIRGDIRGSSKMVCELHAL